MTTINVIIQPDGIHAKEANPHGRKEPVARAFEDVPAQVAIHKKQWQDAEATLRAFEIDFKATFSAKNPELSDTKYSPDAIRKAEILPSGKIKIL